MVCNILNCINNRSHDTGDWEPLNCTVETRDDEDLPLFSSHESPQSLSRKNFTRSKRSVSLKQSISTKRLKEVFGMFHFPLNKSNQHMNYQEHRMLFAEDGSDTSESYIYDLSIQKSGSVDSWMSFSEDGYSCDAAEPAQFHPLAILDISDLSDLSASFSSSSSSSSEDCSFDDVRSMYSI